MHHLVQRPPHNAMCSCCQLMNSNCSRKLLNLPNSIFYGHFTWMQSRHENAARSCVSSVLVRPYMQGSGLADLRFSSLSRGSWLHKSLGKLSLATLDTLRIEMNWVPQTLENSWEFCVPNCRWGTHLFQVKGLVDFALASFANDVQQLKSLLRHGIPWCIPGRLEGLGSCLGTTKGTGGGFTLNKIPKPHAPFEAVGAMGCCYIRECSGSSAWIVLAKYQVGCIHCKLQVRGVHLGCLMMASLPNMKGLRVEKTTASLLGISPSLSLFLALPPSPSYWLQMTWEIMTFPSCPENVLPAYICLLKPSCNMG